MTERRTRVRSRQLKTGGIVFNGGKSVLSCVIRNISQAGACLLVSSPFIVPSPCELLASGERRSCTVVWRQPDRIGVKYQ